MPYTRKAHGAWEPARRREDGQLETATGRPTDRGRPLAFRHVGLQVADVERSCTFYRDVIGLAVVERLVRDDAYLRQVTGYPDVTLDIGLLVEPRSGVLLELLEYRGVERRPVDPSTANPGTAHVCFEVDDVDAAWERALAAGHAAVNPPVTPTSGRWTGGRSVYLLDPDGIRVELVQLGPPAPGAAGPTAVEHVATVEPAPNEPGPAPTGAPTMTRTPAPVESEAVFLVEVDFAPDAAERRVPYRPEHLERIAGLRREGVIVEAGAFLDHLTTSVLLVRATSDQDALRVAMADVYMRVGVWTAARARPFGRVKT